MSFPWHNATDGQIAAAAAAGQIAAAIGLAMTKGKGWIATAFGRAMTKGKGPAMTFLGVGQIADRYHVESNNSIVRIQATDAELFLDAYLVAVKSGIAINYGEFAIIRSLFVDVLQYAKQLDGIAVSQPIR